MRLKKHLLLQHWPNPSLRHTLQISCIISVIVSVCMHVSAGPCCARLLECATGAMSWMHCTGCLLPCPIQCGHGCKHGVSSAVSLSPCDFNKGKKSTSTFGLKNAPGSTPSWTRDVRCRVHEHRFMQLPVMGSPGPRTKAPSMGWIFYRCRHTGLGIVIGLNTRQYVRHSLICTLQSLC